jgi:hypothetical protein
VYCRVVLSPLHFSANQFGCQLLGLAFLLYAVAD